MLQINVEQVQQDRYVSVIGEINIDVMEQFRKDIMAAAGDARGVVTIDASQLGYAYSDGLSVLVELQARLSRVGGRIRILNPTLILRNLFAVTALDRIIPIVELKENALTTTGRE